MKRADLEKGALLAVGAGVLLFWRRELVNTTVDVITRGARLTQTKLNGEDPAYIDTDPADLVAVAEDAFGGSLAHGAFSSLDVYALARMSRSEADARDGDLSRTARMHVALNDARDLQWSPSRLMLYSKNADANGYFGEQRLRRYATTRDPYAGDVQLAWRAIDEDAQGLDPTGGAVKFVDRDSMGVQKGSGSFDALVERWAKEGLQPFNVDGLTDNFVVFRRA